MTTVCFRVLWLMPMLAMLARADEGKPPFRWLARPAQVEPQILAWAEKYPDWVSVEKLKTHGGHTAYAVTVTNAKIDDSHKCKLLVAQPHAHEPAATAGMMDFLAQLLDGADLAGRPTNLDRRQILDHALLSFIPLGNPDGRSKAPVDWWDGAKYSNDEFLAYAFGRESDGRRADRVGRWDDRQHKPALVGIVYEQINDHEYVEPNRDVASSYFRLIHLLRKRRSYDLILDLHQTEFERSDKNCMIILPFMQKQLPAAIQDRNLCWGQAIISAWQRTGGRPSTDLQPLGYDEDQIRYFRKCWGDIFSETSYLCVEIQNNNPRTLPQMQMQLMETSIRTAIDVLLPQNR